MTTSTIRVLLLVQKHSHIRLDFVFISSIKIHKTCETDVFGINLFDLINTHFIHITSVL